MVNHIRSNWKHILEELSSWYDVLRPATGLNYIPSTIGN